MTATNIINAINNTGFTDAELAEMGLAIRSARAQLARRKIRTFSLGTAVKFSIAKTGLSMLGAVEKVGTKFVIVNTQQGRYRVPANMLEII